VVHGDHGRLLALLGEGRVEPLDPPAVERPAFGAGDRRVEADQSQRTEVDRVGGRLVALAGQPERLAQRRPQVVVAGQDVRLEVERREQLAQPPVLLGRPVVGEVAGDEQCVGVVGEREDRLDRAQQALVGVGPVPARADVRIWSRRKRSGSSRMAGSPQLTRESTGVGPEGRSWARWRPGAPTFNDQPDLRRLHLFP
jgi:hypothetical protein